MRRIAATLAVCLVTTLSISGRQPTVVVDGFDDGNADGWCLGYSHHTPWVDGNWRVQGGTLLQDQAGDAFIALASEEAFGDQSIATDVRLNGPAGYGGLALWYRDPSTWVAVYLYPAARAVGA